MHEILRFLLESVASAPPAPDNSVKIAVITAVSVVVAAAITAFATTFTRNRDDDRGDQDYVDELVRRAEVAEQRSEQLEAQKDSLVSRVDELERYCWQAGVDPNTGDPVVRIRMDGDVKPAQ